jgi:hypothetical protein
MLFINSDNQIYSGDRQIKDRALSEDEIMLFNRGTGYVIENGNLVDISMTPEYKLSQFQKAIQYQHDAFNEYSRQIVYQINYNRALGNTTLVTSLNNQLKAEQQAVITRINVITEAYNANNQQST